MIFVTGDTHGEFLRFNTSAFPEQRSMTRDDYVLICGDFGGVWNEKAGPEEDFWLDWLDDKPFTTFFVDGNHENYTRLNSDEFKTVEMFGNEVQKIRGGIYRLLRGRVYEIQGKRFFTFGGAVSHDIEDGILDPAAFATRQAFEKEYLRLYNEGRRFRAKGITWWPEELPSAAEMDAGLRALSAADNRVDYVLTHCLPFDAAAQMRHREIKPDALTLYFNALLENGLRFEKWYCGHYHTDMEIGDNFRVLHRDILRLF